MKKLKKFAKASVALVLACLMFLLSACNLGIIEGAQLDKEIYVNEFMAVNTQTIIDMDGEPSDWIEIRNNTDTPVNLEGYTLSDNPEKPDKWEFPSCEIAANGYIIVFASGKNKEINGELHTNFSLSADGETVILTSVTGRTLSKINYPSQNADVSTGVIEVEGERKIVKFREATPGEANKGDYFELGNVLTSESFPLAINEITPRDAYSHYTETGAFEQWIEIINKSNERVKADDFYLSEDEEKPLKYRLPSVYLEPGEVLVVFLTGNATSNEEKKEYHSNFSIAADEKTIGLYHISGNKADSVEIPSNLRKNNSYGRSITTDKWVYFAKPTPGKANTTEEFSSLSVKESLASSSLKITEASTANVSGLKLTNTTYLSKYGISFTEKRYADWIELYNSGKEDINLSDYMLTDGNSEVNGFSELPAYVIKAGEYKVVFVGLKEDYYQKKSGEIGTTVKLNAAGDTVLLVSKTDGTVLDYMETGRQFDYLTAGKENSFSVTETCFFTSATPGEKNPESYVTKVSRMPEFSQDGGFVSEGTAVTLSHPDKNAEIYYTTDGSLPTKNSKKYTESIIIDKTTVIRAIAIEKDCLQSVDLSRTFFVGVNHTLGILSVSTGPDAVYDEDTGMFGYQKNDAPEGTTHGQYIDQIVLRKKLKDYKHPASVEYYVNGGNLAVDFDGEISLFGQYSLVTDQKSMKIELKGSYGSDELDYPIIPGNEVNFYNGIVLRNGGYPDASRSRIADLVYAKLAKTALDIDVMDGIPVVVYLNGEYWGVYNLRERFDADYLANRYGYNPDTTDILKGNGVPLHGTNADYKALKAYILTHDLSKKEYYDYVCSQVDIESLINWWCVESFLVNTDSGNIKFFRDRESGKWRWFLFDLDWSLNGNNYKNGKYDMLGKFCFDPEGHGVGNGFETWLMCGLVKNEEFKDLFCHRFAYVIQVVFEKDRTETIVDSLAALIRDEIPSEIKRWKNPENEYGSCPSSVTYWENSVKSLKNKIEDRKSYAIKEFKKFFKLTDEELEHYLTVDEFDEPLKKLDIYGNEVTA